jgi:hypothetical protein
MYDHIVLCIVHLPKKRDRAQRPRPKRTQRATNDTGQHGPEPRGPAGGTGTKTGTDTHHQAPEARTAQNRTPHEAAAQTAKNRAATNDPNATQTTQPDRERTEGRRHRNEPAPRAHRRTTETGTGTTRNTTERYALRISAGIRRDKGGRAR